MKIYDLPCFDHRKSFNGKATVIEDNGIKKLKSYETIVCKINKNGKLIKLWDGYSATTMRHINSFVKLFDIDGGGKKWWDDLKCINR